MKWINVQIAVLRFASDCFTRDASNTVWGIIYLNLFKLRLWVIERHYGQQSNSAW